MKFSDRKSKYKRIQKIDLNGVPLPEAFYAMITDEVIQEGTPLNAENMNKGNWRDDETISFASKGIGTTTSAEPDVTQIYTDETGETWLIPPRRTIERYKLSSGQAALDNLNNLRDATTGRIDSLQEILNNSFNIHTRSCMVNAYDRLELTASEYDGKSVKALDFDVYGELMLVGNKKNPSGYGIFELRDPTTGQKDFLQNIVNNLFNLMAEPFTSYEYDNLYGPGISISAQHYDKKDITAINFDMRGKSLMI